MPENRDFAWLRSTLCDEIDAVRNGTADHSRAKSVAALAAAALKSVEVKAMVRQQHAALAGTDVAPLGSIGLCAPHEEQEPAVPQAGASPEETSTPEGRNDAGSPGQPAASAASSDSKDHEITQINGFKVGGRVLCPNGKGGSITKVTTSGRIEVKEDGGGTFPYSAKHLKPELLERPKITSPIATGQPRFVAGRSGSGSA